VSVRANFVLAGYALAVGAERHRDTSERQGAQQEAEVAQRDVAVAADDQQVHDDAAEPAGDQQAAEPWRDRDDAPARISMTTTMCIASEALPGMISLNAGAR
jgi:hypothetical protein